MKNPKILCLFTIIVFLLTSISAFSLDSQQSSKEYPNSQTITPKPTAGSSKTKLVWPLPSSISLDENAQETEIDPCAINFTIQATPSDAIKMMIEHYQTNIFKCKVISNGTIQFIISVANATKYISESTVDEQYQLNIRTTDKWQLVTYTYVGFLRGLETFSQLVEKKNNKFVLNGLPIYIDDVPNFHWRGVMIDTSRHFLPVTAIKHQIDALLYNKMTILHWHITDEDSFPIVIESRPELANYGKLSGVYTKNDVSDIINYAKFRGVRVIPEFDSPAHTESWGRSPQLEGITIKCNNEYEGQFDPTIELTYKVIEDVLKEVKTIFSDEYVHFGGDEISSTCYDRKPSVKQWMKENGVDTYKDLSNYYRNKQKSIWRGITPTKKAIYWTNKEIDMPLDSDDVIHWWGLTSDLKILANRTNQVILSNYDLTYLDFGYGGRRATGYRTHVSWRDLYKFDPSASNVNVIGGETCMWSEVSNENVQDQKVWPKTSVLNERLWNTNIDGKKDILNIAERLIAQTKRMKERGFKPSPVTVGLCEKDPKYCWNESE